MWTKINEAADFLKEKAAAHLGEMPRIAIVLGTGLGRLAEEIENPLALPYADIPHFPVSTVEGHSGRLLLGRLGGRSVLAMQGRFHYYEGYAMQEVTFPVRVMREVGIRTLFVSNASGGLNPDFRVGDLMLITDHINFFPEHPLRGRNLYGDRFPDMSEAYDRTFIAEAFRIAREKDIPLQQGIYVGTQGPTYETPAECRMFWLWGADAVGMSTVPEVIVARHCGMKVFGVSVITNLCHPDAPQVASHEEVQQAADAAGARMTSLMREMIAQA